LTLEGSPYRGIKPIKPSGWGTYSKETGKLLSYHSSEDVVRRWANGDPEVEVRKVEKRKP
jgi:hypothetical protein